MTHQACAEEADWSLSTTLRKPNSSSAITRNSNKLSQPQPHPISTRPGPYPFTNDKLPTASAHMQCCTHDQPTVHHPSFCLPRPQEQECLPPDIAWRQDQHLFWHSEGSSTPQWNWATSALTAVCSPVNPRFQGNDLRNIKTRNTNRSVEQQPNMGMIRTTHSSTNGNPT